MESIFLELSLVIAVALLVAFIARLLRQPLIVGYILAGIVVSPYFLGVIKSFDNLIAFSQIGVAVLLFTVGLNLDLKVIKNVGKISLITGMGQIAFTFAIGYLAAMALGFSSITSAYIAIAISFSSTIIIMKLLSDKEEISTLYGKISIGFLIVQDLVAILILMIVSSLSGESSFSSLAFQKIGIGAGMLISLGLIGLYVLPWFTKKVAKSQELLLLFSVAWAMAIASLFDYFGFSIEIGALLAGISLAGSTYRYEIGAKIKPIRDFFLLLFFIILGAQLSFGEIQQTIIPAIIFSLIVLVGNPLIVMFLMGRAGYTKRTGFLAGTTVSQISEFSFIVVALGISVGHIENSVLSMMTFIGLSTMAISSYIVTYSHKIYPKLSNILGIFERNKMKIDEGRFYGDENFEIILFGHNRVGFGLRNSFTKLKKKFLIVDNNPETIERLVKSGVDCRYGDADDSEMLEELPLKSVKMVVSTIPDYDTNIALIEKIKRINKKAVFVFVSHHTEEAVKLYDAGADYVVMPHILGSHYASNLIERCVFDKNKFAMESERSLKDLRERQKEGHRDVIHERG